MDTKLFKNIPTYRNTNEGQNMKPWYEELFEDYAEEYEKESFTQGTLGEVDFFENEIGHDTSKTVLDVGCGTGRHALELAKRGYCVTGIDLSVSQLKHAQKLAAEHQLSIDFLQEDARHFRFERTFDLVIMICEGAFPLMETDAMNFQILENAYNSLADKGKFIFTTLNGLYPLFHAENLCKESSSLRFDNNAFDLLTSRAHHHYERIDADGEKKIIQCNERFYLPTEITWLLKSLNFKNIELFGAELGAFSRKEELRPKHFEMLVVAEK